MNDQQIHEMFKDFSSRMAHSIQLECQRQVMNGITTSISETEENKMDECFTNFSHSLQIFTDMQFREIQKLSTEFEKFSNRQNSQNQNQAQFKVSKELTDHSQLTQQIMHNPEYREQRMLHHNNSDRKILIENVIESGGHGFDSGHHQASSDEGIRNEQEIANMIDGINYSGDDLSEGSNQSSIDDNQHTFEEDKNWYQELEYNDEEMEEGYTDDMGYQNVEEDRLMEGRDIHIDRIIESQDNMRRNKRKKDYQNQHMKFVNSHNSQIEDNLFPKITDPSIELSKNSSLRNSVLMRNKNKAIPASGMNISSNGMPFEEIYYEDFGDPSLHHRSTPDTQNINPKLQRSISRRSKSPQNIEDDIILQQMDEKYLHNPGRSFINNSSHSGHTQGQNQLNMDRSASDFSKIPTTKAQKMMILDLNENEVQLLKKNLQQSQEQNVILSKEIRGKNRQIDDLKYKLEIAQSTNSAHGSSILNIRIQEQAMMQVNNIKSLLENEKTNVDNLLLENKNLGTSVESLTMTMEQQIERHSSEINQQKVISSSYKANSEQLTKKIQLLEEDIYQFNATIEELQDGLRGKNSEISRIEEDKRRIVDRNEELVDTLERQEKEMTEFISENSKLKKLITKFNMGGGVQGVGRESMDFERSNYNPGNYGNITQGQNSQQGQDGRPGNYSNPNFGEDGRNNFSKSFDRLAGNGGDGNLQEQLIKTRFENNSLRRQIAELKHQKTSQSVLASNDVDIHKASTLSLSTINPGYHKKEGSQDRNGMTPQSRRSDQNQCTKCRDFIEKLDNWLSLIIEMSGETGNFDDLPISQKQDKIRSTINSLKNELKFQKREQASLEEQRMLRGGIALQPNTRLIEKLNFDLRSAITEKQELEYQLNLKEDEIVFERGQTLTLKVENSRLRKKIEEVNNKLENLESGSENNGNVYLEKNKQQVQGGYDNKNGLGQGDILDDDDQPVTTQRKEFMMNSESEIENNTQNQQQDQKQQQNLEVQILENYSQFFFNDKEDDAIEQSTMTTIASFSNSSIQVDSLTDSHKKIIEAKESKIKDLKSKLSKANLKSKSIEQQLTNLSRSINDDNSDTAKIQKENSYLFDQIKLLEEKLSLNKKDLRVKQKLNQELFSELAKHKELKEISSKDIKELKEALEKERGKFKSIKKTNKKKIREKSKEIKNSNKDKFKSLSTQLNDIKRGSLSLQNQAHNLIREKNYLQETLNQQVTSNMMLSKENKYLRKLSTALKMNKGEDYSPALDVDNIPYQKQVILTQNLISKANNSAQIQQVLSSQTEFYELSQKVQYLIRNDQFSNLERSGYEFDYDQDEINRNLEFREADGAEFRGEPPQEEFDLREGGEGEEQGMEDEEIDVEQIPQSRYNNSSSRLLLAEGIGGIGNIGGNFDYRNLRSERIGPRSAESNREEDFLYSNIYDKSDYQNHQFQKSFLLSIEQNRQQQLNLE